MRHKHLLLFLLQTQNENQSSDQAKPNPTVLNQNPRNQTLAQCISEIWATPKTMNKIRNPRLSNCAEKQWNWNTTKNAHVWVLMCIGGERESWCVHPTAEESSWSLVERKRPSDWRIWEPKTARKREVEEEPSGLGKEGIAEGRGWEKRVSFGRGSFWVFGKRWGYFGNEVMAALEFVSDGFMVKDHWECDTLLNWVSDRIVIWRGSVQGSRACSLLMVCNSFPSKTSQLDWVAFKY